MKRRFLKVGERRVHYFRAGDGPPAVLIHSSPASARLLMKEIERLAEDHTVFAFDTPGFGLSDPLPLAEMVVADLADALADTLAAIGMPACPVYGTHTGAAIALEFGVRHPERATGLVLDGVPAFTDAECSAYFGEYFQKMPASALGGHYAEAWTRFRDQSIWFPWTNKTPDHLNAYDLSPAHSTQLWVSMFFEAADHYVPAYRAASFYGARANAAAAELTLPAVYCATDTDMLYPHLARLPPMKPEQSIVPIGSSYERRRDLIADSFMRFGSRGPAPVDRDALASTSDVERQFVDGRDGQVHLRTCGDRTAPMLVLVHDSPGSSEQAVALIARLAERFFVVAPDLPGCGESDAHSSPPALDDYADDVAYLLDRLGVATATLYGIGFGSSVALAFAARYPARTTAVAIQGVALPDGAERAELRLHLAPPIAVEPDGAHWYRTWLMLRDSQVYWPWFDRRMAALRRVPADLSAQRLHRWTMDVMRAHASYAQPIDAALDGDTAAMLCELIPPLLIVADASPPLSVYDDRLCALRPAAAVFDFHDPALVDALAAHAALG